jgi:hypothetical protein
VILKAEKASVLEEHSAGGVDIEAKRLLQEAAIEWRNMEADRHVR